MTHLAEKSEPSLVLRGTSTRSRVLPVQIQTIESMSPQKFDGRLDKCLSVGLSGHHDGEPEEMCLTLKRKRYHKCEIFHLVCHVLLLDYSTFVKYDFN